MTTNETMLVVLLLACIAGILWYPEPESDG